MEMSHISEKKCTDRRQSVDITIPASAEYVSVVRLTASGVANRMGFDIEQIEDIKVAVAEVCNRAVLKDDSGEGTCTLRFFISEDKLTVLFKSSNYNINDLFKDDEGLGLSLINALMDEVMAGPDGDKSLEMTKII